MRRLTINCRGLDQSAQSCAPGSAIAPWLILLLLSVSVPARADWLTFTVPGTPVHLSAKAPSSFVVTTDQGVYEVNATGIVRSYTFSGLAAGFIDGSDCLGGGTSSGGQLSSSTCAYGYSPFSGAGQTLGTIALTSAGTGYAPTLAGVSPEVRYSGSTTTPTKPQWLAVPLGVFSPHGKASALRAGANDYGLFPGTATAAPMLLLAKAETPVGQFRNDAGLGVVALFEQSPGSVQALNAPPSGGLQVLSFDGGTVANALPVSTPATGAITSLAYSNAPDQTFGLGIQTAGGLIGAVPDSSPARAARSWVPFTTTPAGFGAMSQVRCIGATTCAITGTTAGVNVAIYRNLAAPSTPTASTIMLDEAQSVVAATTVTDADGDAVMTTWTPPAAAPFTLTLQPDGVSALLSADRPRSEYCSLTPQAIAVTSRDGINNSIGAGTVTVTVRHTVPPDPPTLSVPSLTILAGSAPQLFSASKGADGCTPTSYSAAMEAGGVAGVSVSGTNPFAVTVPATYCNQTPGTARVLVKAIDSAGTSDAGVVTVQLQPWGPPLAPFAAGASVTQAAGTTGNYTRAAGHACEVAAGFPGVSTKWEAGVGAVSGVQVRVNGQPLPQTGATLQVVSTDTCASGTVQVTATNETNAVAGPPASFTIQIQPNPRPLADAGFTLSAAFDGGAITGNTEVPGLDCLGDRNLTVDLRVERAARLLLLETAKPLGAFSLTGAPLHCAGDQVDVVAALSAEGTASGKTARVPLAVPSQPVGLTGFTADALLARCGETAKGTVVLETGHFCATPGFSLIPSSTELSVAVRVQQIDGGIFLVETEATELGALLGKNAQLIASADGGAGNGGQIPVSIGFTADPFVQVARGSSSVVVAGNSPVTHTVELTNTTACAVSNVTFRERLNGRRFVEGSARVDGEKVEVSSSNEAITVAGILLPAGRTVRFSYSARLLPFANTLQMGEAFIGPTVISLPQSTDAASGCGCQLLGTGLLPYGAALLVVALRRSCRGRARV